MRAYDVIKKKRDGLALSREEIEFFINGYINGDIADEQAAALLMAVFFKGMNENETLDLTNAIIASGEVADLSNIEGIKVDKHSTGGVGDKTTLVVIPIVASCGVKAAKLSGRGLGHTGGTIDKLESIAGFKTTLSAAEFAEIVNRVGAGVAGQSANLAPADKKLYALRDITATVDEPSLIASSIMSKKLASGADKILLDVKIGSGSFNKTLEQGRRLARIMTSIGNNAGKQTVAVLTDMDKPLGCAIGNSIELIEAVETLKGNGPADLVEVCITLAAYMLNLAGVGSVEYCKKLAQQKINNGDALEKLREIVMAQGGRAECLSDYDLLPRAEFEHQFTASKSGYINGVDCEKYGIAAALLGAGREKKQDKIDYGAGIYLLKKNGDHVNKGDVIARLYTSKHDASDALKTLEQATVISDICPEASDTVIEIIQ